MATKSKEASKATGEVVVIKPPRFRTVQFTLVGTSPLMQSRVSQRSLGKIKEIVTTEEVAGKKKKKPRKARDPNAEVAEAMHVSREGWIGIPASAIRVGCVEVCRMTDLDMTSARLSIFVVADGYDKVDGQSLIKLFAGQHEVSEMAVRNANGNIDIRFRPVWKEWTLKPRIRFDEDQLRLSDVTNLVARLGMQMGIGEGRVNPKKSCGLGYGLFEIQQTGGAK